MSRLVVLLALASAPLLAAAHDGHHAASHEAAAAEARDDAAANGSIRATVAAPSRCPGGGHDDCCCHDATCTPSYQPVAIDERPVSTVTPRPRTERVAPELQAAPRALAVDRHSPRGPPPHS